LTARVVSARVESFRRMPLVNPAEVPSWIWYVCAPATDIQRSESDVDWFVALLAGTRSVGVPRPVVKVWTVE
jgi:hypothetical protein